MVSLFQGNGAYLNQAHEHVPGLCVFEKFQPLFLKMHLLLVPNLLGVHIPKYYMQMNLSGEVFRDFISFLEMMDGSIIDKNAGRKYIRFRSIFKIGLLFNYVINLFHLRFDRKFFEYSYIIKNQLAQMFGDSYSFFLGACMKIVT